MALMQSCCCWRSVRRGSFACALYTGIYFALIAATTGMVLMEEHQYIWGNRSLPVSTSLLEPESMSHATMNFYASLFVCSCFGVSSCVLLLVGLFKDRRLYLLPWILNIIACSLLDVMHTLYLFISQGFNPITALVYTLNFFLLCLNVYSLLCVISQYQEYVAGRGRAIDDCGHRVPAIRYAVQPTTTTATSCLSSRRTNTAGNNETKGASVTATTTASPSQSPTASHHHQTINSSLLGKSVSPTGGNRTVKKHVQFPDLSRDVPEPGSTTQNIGVVRGSPTIAKENVSTGGASSFLLPPGTEQSQPQHPQQQQSTRNQAES